MKTAFDFNFDEWAELAKRDPEAFAQRRAAVVKETCERMDARIRPAVEGICWRIEIERQRSKTPMQLCLKLSSLMWNKHSDLTNTLYALNESGQSFLKLFRQQRGQRRTAEKPQLHLVVFPSSSDNQD